MDDDPQDLTNVVRWPGALLVTAGVLQLALTVASTAVVALYAPQLEEMFERLSPAYQPSGATDPFGPFNLAMSAFAVLLAALAIAGGLQMMRLRSWKLALTAAVVVMIPCTGPCCGLFLPVGIWALVVLLREDVRAAMTSDPRNVV